MASPTTTKNLKDANLSVSAALPNAANTVNSNSIDLVQAAPYPATERFTVKLSTIGGNGANNKNINIRLQESADNGNWTNIAVFANPLLQVTDNNGAGSPAASVTVQLAPTAKRYLRAAALGEANGGDASNGTFTVDLLF